ncbi:mechanosensitive ion channel family protein [Halobacteriales archaeon Cl-PHB]
MDPLVLAGSLLAVTETPAPGPEQLVDLWPLVIRAAWFVGAFVAVALVGLVVVEPAVSRVVRSRNRNNPTLEDAISRYVRLVVLVVALVLATSLAGYGYLIADSALVIAAGTLAIGVAGQRVIGSMVSGVALVSDPEFNVGDYIQWSEGEGHIQSITLRVTRVVSPDGELITVPNTTLTDEAVTRPYGRARYRVVEQIGFSYDDDPHEGLSVLVEAAEDLDVVADEPSPNAFVDELDPNAVMVNVHYWIADPSTRNIYEIRSKFASAAKARLEEAGVTVSPATKRDLEGRIAVERDG